MSTREEDRQRPYASPANVISVLGRVRRVNLRERIDDDLLRVAGVPEGAMHRVHTTLRFLRLTNDDQTSTDTLGSLVSGTDEQYRQTLEGAVRAAYASDFERIDPGQDTQAQIIDQFRQYEPRSQTGRMVTLFLGLCREAGIPVLDAPRERQQRPVTPRARTAGATPALRQRVQRARQEQREEQMTPPAPSGLMFGVTEDDIAALDEKDFEVVWSALGRVARARARSKQQQAAESPAENGEDGEPTEEDSS
jgi:Family of unknown function (DUF5343)